MTIRALVLCLVLACSLGAVAADWETYTSEAGGWSVQGPGPPEVKVKTTRTPLGALQDTTCYWRVPGVQYTVEFSELPDLATVLGPTPIWVEIEQGFQSRVGGTVSNQRDFQFQGNPARSLDFAIPAKGDKGPRTGHAQAVLVGSWLYVLTASWDGEEIPPDQGQAFFSSFLLTR